MKLWQNLRASRATELAGVFPGHVASAFLGHSERVAQKHYWQVTDEDFKKRAQNTTQQAHARGRIGSQGMTGENEKGPTLPEDAPPCDLRQDSLVGDTRLELVTSAV